MRSNIKSGKIYLFWVLIVTLILNDLSIAGQTEYNVIDFGAKGDGSVLETQAIQKAINTAYENGGGIVVIPQGTYKTGTLILKDNINLHLLSGAVLLGSGDINDYVAVDQKIESRTRGLYAKYFFIYAEGAKNISITGSGIINGNGKENFQTARPQNKRPYMIRFAGCQNVTFRDIQLLESGNWTLHILNCKDVIIDGVKLYNSTQGGNRDGMDIDGCENVSISNCRIWSVDDAIVLKSTNNKVCKNVTITNCSISSYASGVKTGTESNGGFENITVSNCIIENIPVHSAIELMTVDGGDLKNITFSNIVMNNVATPIFIYLGNRARPYKAGQYVKKVSAVQDIYFNNLTITGAKLPSGVVGLNYKQVKNISFSNISVRCSETLKGQPIAVNAVPLKDFSYPMARMFGVNMPAYGFYCRNIDGIRFNNINIFSADGEKRPAIVFDRVKNIYLNSVNANCENKNSEMVYLRNVNSLNSMFCAASQRISALFTAEKNNSNNLHLINNFMKKGQMELRETPALSDKEIYADFKSGFKYSIKNGDKINGLTAQNIAEKPLIIDIDMPEKGTPQICLLTKAEGKLPQKVIISYNNTIQDFTIDWNVWGWAPITLSGKFEKNKKMRFTIKSADSSSKLYLSKVFLKVLNLGYTD